MCFLEICNNWTYSFVGRRLIRNGGLDMDKNWSENER